MIDKINEQIRENMRNYMAARLNEKDQMGRESYFLVNYDKELAEHFVYDHTQAPPTVWIKRIDFEEDMIEEGDYEETSASAAQWRWETLVKKELFVRWTPEATECHLDEPKVKFHRIHKNDHNVYQTVWSDLREKHYFTVSASTLAGQVDETMCFRSDAEGNFSGADECGVVYPAQREQTVHRKMVKDALQAMQMEAKSA